MIVRLNQLEIARAEATASWPAEGLQGAIEYEWPATAQAFEIHILPTDEKSQPLTVSFRQTQLRKLVPEIAATLIAPREELVVRLDGPVLSKELSAAFAYLTTTNGEGRFSISAVQKLSHGPDIPIGSVRIQPSPATLASLCADESVGLHQSVRLRLISIAEDLVNPLLDIDETDDERWPEVLGQSRFVLSTAKDLKSLILITTDISPEETRSLITRRLAAGFGSSKPSG